MTSIDKICTPQLNKIHSGKVRESFRVNDKKRLIFVSDRISSFDFVLNNLIPFKGTILNSISNYWFEKTKHIVKNHFIRIIDPNINMVKEADPIRIEMIVRGYLAGSMWRNYKKGKREFSGIKIEDGYKRNQRFKKPLLTPTTKEKEDREITPKKIIKEGWATKDIYNKMEKISLELYKFGRNILEKKGIILVDTKYEFGLLNDELILIDEIHTPDSSRFWSKSAYEKEPTKVDSIDKEFVRQWLLKNKEKGKFPDKLPENIIRETSQRYIQIYEKILGKKFTFRENNIKKRIYKNLLKENLLKEGYVSIIMGSVSDMEHCKKIKKYLEKYNVFVNMRVLSAHKNGERIPVIADVYNNSIEPGAIIAVAGRSNGLGPALAANLNIPVINCPPFKDTLDMMVNINSSLMTPSRTPAMTVIEAKSAALAALRCLNLTRLKNIFSKEIQNIKKDLLEKDNMIKNQN